VSGRVSARARLREDRAGDPLDGLVNLFDLGVVLAVAFLLAALQAIDLSPAALKENRAAAKAAAREAPSQAQEDPVVVGPDEQARELRLKPGERVVGSGKPVGTVYRLDDGRTILVRPKDEGGAGASAPGGGDGPPASGAADTPGG
jgi:hypothetical protein